MFALSTVSIVGAGALREQGTYLAQGYMLIPAISAIIARLFFYQPGFKDANLRFGRIKDYLKFWLFSIGITLLSFALFTVLGGITWDFTGQTFLERLSRQFAANGKDISTGLPPGFTPQMMLIIFFVGGLTVFNIIPGIISGFGEEFGHRGFMFPLLYRIRPWVGIVIGGLIWYAWHLPLALVIPQAVQNPHGQTLLNFIMLAIGSVCTFTFLAYVYVKSESVWVTSVAHITLNNAAASLSYFSIVRDQALANIGLTLTMIIVVAFLYYSTELKVFATYFAAMNERYRVSGQSS